MSVKDKIIALFNQKNELSVVEIVTLLDVSKQFVHRVLNSLLDEKLIIKIGKAPKTFYKLKEIETASLENNETFEESKIAFLNQNFLVITEIGELLTGFDGFQNWCKKRKLPISKTLDEYIITKQKYSKYFDKNNLISGLDKLKSTKGYDKIHLNELYYLDFYAIERFGKTRLGTILHYAKQGQNKMLMKMLINEIKNPINLLIRVLDIDAIAFVPPTIKRETQLMKVIENGIKVNKPKIEIIKVGGIIPIPQKSLNKIEERIANAENSFVIRGNVSFKNLLLIDDAVGSGSTLNQIAGKIKSNGLAENIIGLAIVGSYKGFDVITDV